MKTARSIEANSLIENLGDHLQWRAQSRIALTDSRANELLSAALAALDSHPEFTVRSFPLRDGDDRAAMVVHLIPIPVPLTIYSRAVMRCWC